MSDDVVAELDRWLEVETRLHHVPPDGAGLIAVAKVQRARDEIVALRDALDESVRLQSHYAALLNDYDGGKRMRFNSDAWLTRLRALREKHDADR